MYVVDTGVEPRHSVLYVPIVHDFLNVFPEDFLGLPPERQVNFRIDLIPGAASIAKALYHLATPKM